MKKKSNLIIETLNNLYPDGKCELLYNNDFELLIAVVLSAQTTDGRVNQVSSLLFQKYPGPFELAVAKNSDVENIIKPIGLYHNKAANIINLSKCLVNNYDGKVPDNREDLEKLPGVGRKTAGIILSNCFNTPAFAVDTHVERVAKRLKIAFDSDSPIQIEEKLMSYFPKKLWGRLHHQFVLFGRYHCKAKNPLCSDCPLKQICSYLE